MRGLGSKQKEQKLLTQAKVASFLSVSPFTYEQLSKITGIQRKILRNRLDELTAKKFVIKHDYEIPYDRIYYGSVMDHPSQYNKLLLKTYYLLNCSNPESSNLISQHLTQTQKGWTIDFTNSNKSNMLPYVPNYRGAIPLTKLGSKLENQSTLTRDQQEKNNLSRGWKALLIWVSRFNRELDMLAIKQKVMLSDTAYEKYLKNVSLVADYFVSMGFSVLDVLIKCSTEVNYLFEQKLLYLPIIRYYELWRLLDRIGYLDHLIS